MSIESQVWTYELSSASLTIDNTFDFTVVSILVTGWTVVVTGGLIAGGLPSTDMTLNEGQGVTFSSGNNNNIILSNITVDATGGIAVITGR